MAFIDMKDYNPPAKLYWWTVTSLGLIAFAWGVEGVLRLDGALMLQVLVGAAVAAIVGFFPVRMPGTKTSIAAAEIFIFLLLMVYGPGAAILAACLEAFVASYRTSKRWTSRLGSPAMAALAMLACAVPFEAARSQVHANGMTSSILLVFAMIFAGLYYSANTVLTSTLFALKSRTPVTPLLWIQKNSWIGLTYVACASIAGLLYLSFERFGLPVLLVAVPVIAMFLSSLHSYFSRREADERHVEELRASESRFHSAFTHAAIGMALVTTDGRFIQANKSFCDMLGRANPDLMATNIGQLVNAADLENLRVLVSRLVAGDMPSIQTELRGLHRDGSDVWMSLNVSLARDWQFRTHNLIVQAQDVSGRRRAEAELYHNAYHDSLTQLANRTHFNEQLTRAIARVERHPDQRFAVMYLDFDRFKMVNDSLGHKAGDELLVNLARRLQSMLRPTDLIARLGGDEFAILLEDVQRERDSVDLAERIQRELQRPFQLGDMEITVSAAIGITFSSNGYQTAEQIIRDADIAMYKAKSKGKAQYALFDASLHQHVASQLKLENELRRALGQGQIYLHYQPICSLRDQRLIGFEALVRWAHPERGALEPATFIPTAEETGLIVPLGNWVLSEACRQLRAWKDAHGQSNLRMSVNVSSLQLTHPEFVARVREALASAALSPGELTLEVTESVLMDGIENAVSTLNELRHMGVTLSIDDFGTGYSSLNYLATLPIDALKVDRSFIERMSDDGDGNEIVKAIFKLGQALSKQVFAEGIETGDQLSRLQALGCEYGQGYLLSRPVDATRAERFVAGHMGPLAIA
ncbi:MAG TPA: EAL domain-containing protein [Usitatibacter sp.]|jgi:diguanylate cyclase (GGDEF)-like protein/PAS domain S-box-containing protein|nr:EAL domain-containing protein [Usitatibacter sp.]